MISVDRIREMIRARDTLHALLNEQVRAAMHIHIASRAADQPTDVHTEHCCVVHGCKYGRVDCSVATERLVQSYPCESCHEDVF